MSKLKNFVALNIKLDDRRSKGNLYIGQNLIPRKTECKYLDIILDKNLNFQSHQNHIKQKTVNHAKRLQKLICKQQGISRKHVTLLYKELCRPLLDYGATLYAT